MDRDPGGSAVSVITAAYNGVGVIGRQMDALATQGTTFPWEYVVVDNGSSDETIDLVRAHAVNFPVPVRIVDGSLSRSIPYVRNLGVENSSSPYLVFCDQDDVVQPGWLQAAYDALVLHPACMGLIRSLDGPTPGRTMNPSVLTSFPLVETCNFAVRKDVLVRAGGFDEGLPGYGGDDSELALRLRLLGYHIQGVPDMVILAQQTTGSVARIKKVFKSAQSEVYIWRKYPEVFPGRLTWNHVARRFLSSSRELITGLLGRAATSRARAARGIVASVGNAYAMLVRRGETVTPWRPPGPDRS